MAPAKASKAVVAPKPVPPFQRVVDEVQAHPTESALIAVSLLAVSSILGLLRKLARVEKELKDTKEVRRRAQRRCREGNGPGCCRQSTALSTSCSISSLLQEHSARSGVCTVVLSHMRSSLPFRS
jgi:hypothetical protein